VLQAVRATMTAAGYCFLVTLDASGHPQARLMDPFEPEGDLTVWMATNATTRKVGQLRKDARATLAYYDVDGIGYVTLMGVVQLVGDLEERSRRWKPDWRMFYPEGPTSQDFLLLEFVPSRIEIMSISRGVAADATGFRPAILERQASTWLLAGG
jgi:general stress protein 26